MSNLKTATPTPLAPIDADALDAVVGGVLTATSSSSTNTRVQNAITSLGSSIKTLGTPTPAQNPTATALTTSLLGGGLGAAGGSAAAPGCPAGCCAMNPLRR